MLKNGSSSSLKKNPSKASILWFVDTKYDIIFGYFVVFKKYGSCKMSYIFGIHIKKYFFIKPRRKPGESKLDFKKLEPQLNRLKNKQYPIKPTTSETMAVELEKPDIREKYGRTLDKQREFYIKSEVRPTFSFHLFASLAVLSFIKDHVNKPTERFYSIDGTFNVVPKGLSQLLIISIQFKNKVCVLFI